MPPVNAIVGVAGRTNPAGNVTTTASGAAIAVRFVNLTVNVESALVKSRFGDAVLAVTEPGELSVNVVSVRAVDWAVVETVSDCADVNVLLVTPAIVSVTAVLLAIAQVLVSVMVTTCPEVTPVVGQVPLVPPVNAMVGVAGRTKPDG